MRVYKKLNISSLDELRQRLEGGEIERLFGVRMAQHIRQGLTDTHAMLLYLADDLSAPIEEFLVGVCDVRRAEAAGDFRRRVDVSRGTCLRYWDRRFPGVVDRIQRYGGRTPMMSSGTEHALFSLLSGLLLRLQLAPAKMNGDFIWSPARVGITSEEAHCCYGFPPLMKRANFNSESGPLS